MIQPVKRVYIIGFMGSGKTTAGKRIASYLEWQFLDLDHEIEKVQGKSIKDIFSESDESYFRELESRTLKAIVTERNTVISAGGGTPCFNDNMDFMLETGLVIYLKLTPAQLITRLEQGIAKRPLLKEKSSSELLPYIAQKLSEREAFYMRANLIVDCTDLDIKNLCQKIIL